MSVHYQAVLWNRQKKLYDATLAAGLILYVAGFAGVGGWLFPTATAETLVIRALGTAAFLLLHVILAIGPAARLDPRFLPLLYNRRHLGVTMFFLAFGHAVFSLIQFHALGDTFPLISLFTANPRYGSVTQFPFESLGFAALLILFLMAATSHDFWLHTLSPVVWKRLHMMVYAAYALLVGHVALGVLQSEPHPAPAVLVAAGMAVLLILHLTAGAKERARDNTQAPVTDGFRDAGDAATIPEGRARVVSVDGERIAIFRHEGKLCAISNVCRHQNGPLGEGRIVDGCVTCPWHGYQYAPETGMSPPPFKDRVPVFRTRVADGRVWVDPRPATSRNGRN